MDQAVVRLIGGMVATSAMLAAQHWFPWWRKLKPVEAYAMGTAAILLGAGIATSFSLDWWRLMAVAAAGGLVVVLAYRHDRRANEKARQRAGVADGQGNPT